MWKYIRLMFVVLLVVSSATAVAVASTTTDVTVTVTPTGPTNGPPLNFTVIYVDATTANITWTKPGTAVNTHIRVKFGDYPSSISDGYLVYSGTSENITDANLYLEENAGTLYYSAWSENATGDYSSEYATDDLENPLMTLIANALSVDLIPLLVIIGITALAFWRRDLFLYLIATPVAIMGGLNWYENHPTDFGLVLAVVMGAIGIYSLFKVVENLIERVKG